MEIFVAFSVADFFNAALNAHHALEFNPVKLQSGKRVARQLLPFAALVVGEPHHAACVVAFDQHHPGARAQVAAHGGQRHGVGLGQLGAQCLFEPLVKLLHRV